MAAAILAARQGAQVTILEHMDRVGKKLLSTGNGRCNLTNWEMREDCYHCGQKDFPMKVLGQFGVEDTLAFFEEIGITVKSKKGYIYPRSEQASAVLDMLRLEVKRLGVQEQTGCEIKELRQKGNRGFLARTNQGVWTGNTLILAAGSRAAPATGSDGSGYKMARGFGHTIIRPLPALVQLRCEGRFFKHLAGVRCEARVAIVSQGEVLAGDVGEVQFTDYGISGIPTFQVSRFAAAALAEGKPVEAVLDFLPGMEWEEAEAFLEGRIKKLPHLTGKDFLTGVFPKKLAEVLIWLAGIEPGERISQKPPGAREELLGHIKAFEAVVTATNSFEQAQVCSGGVDTREVFAETMESKLAPGLYLVGEILDVDGICGGYNLQWAWSTGCIAGKHGGA